MGMEIDHVVSCVPDLDAAVSVFEKENDVVSVAGGRHEGHGTANRLVPLGPSYIELVAVVDAPQARLSEFGLWVASRSTLSGADSIAIRTDDLDEVCGRLALHPLAMSRKTPEGDELRWRIAGFELVSSGLPFFIEWDIDPGLHPGRAPADHPRGAVSLGEVVISGDERRLRRWTEGVSGVAVESGAPGVRFELDGGYL